MLTITIHAIWSIMRNVGYLASRYRAGLTLRQLGAEVGRSEHWVRLELHRRLGSQRYRALVLDVLLGRIARARGKRLKHAIWVLRRVKPHEYAKAVARSKKLTEPKRCSSCGKRIQARSSAGMWIWNCEWCGKGGIERSLVL